MAWTYTNAPATVTRDQLRFLIGDVDGDDPQLTDEELDWLLTAEGNVYMAALAAAQSLQALYARKVDKAVGDLKVSYSQRSKQYAQLVDNLKRKGSVRLAMPFAGGTSKSQKDSVTDDSDRVDPAFARNQFDHYAVATEPDKERED